MRRILASLLFVSFAVLAVPAEARPHYPMKAPEYRKIVGARVEAVWERIDKKLEFHNVTGDRKKEIRRTFDTAAKEVFAEVDKVAADGTVTRDEALRVGAMTSALRGKVRGKLASEKKAADKPTVADKPAASAKPPADKPAAKKPVPPPEKPGAKKPAEPPVARKPAPGKSDAGRAPTAGHKKVAHQAEADGDE